jgi:16S rRNA (uracil1498-N3)-methyltransferase
MRTTRIYLDAEFAAAAILPLPQTLARYVGKVLRLPAGAELLVFDGRGAEWLAELQFVDGAAQLQLKTPQPGLAESPLAVTLLQGIGRGERMDYAIQKAVELGVAAIQPVFTERTVVKLNPERLQKRMLHWQGIIVSACEQCGRSVLPTLLPAALLEAALQISADAKWLLAPAAQQPLASTKRPQSAALLVGPEGGLSEAEISAAEAAGWQPWQLGPRVLRTETAGTAALAVLQARWGDFAELV